MASAITWFQIPAIGMEGAGHFAMITDTEGNTVGLHSQS